MVNLAPDRESWEEEHRDGRWSYLDSAAERARHATIARRVLARPEPAVLDLGCGRGTLYRALGGPDFPGRYLGVDWSLAALGDIRPTARHHVVCADLAQLPVCGAFDVVVLSEVVYYLPDPVDLVRRARLLVAVGGELIVSLYQPRNRSAARWGPVVARIGAALASLPGLAERTEVRDPGTGRVWQLTVLAADTPPAGSDRGEPQRRSTS